MAATQKLNPKQVKSLGPGRWSDGDGLMLVVKESGARSWVVSFRVNGVRKEMGLGRAGSDDVTLAQARELGAEARKVARTGVHPAEAKRAVAAATFGPYAKAYIEEREADWSKIVRASWRNSLLAHCRAWEEKPLAQITVADVLGVLRPIWSTKPEIAQMTQRRIARVLDAARVDRLHEGDNPARWIGHLEHKLSARQKLTRGHHASLPYTDAPAFMARLRSERGGQGALALELTLLCGVRTSETLLAKWSEFDLEAKVWSIPAARTKSAKALKAQNVKAHRVPLSAAAVAVLRKVGVGKPDAFVFPGVVEGKAISGGTMAAVLKRMKVDVTVHGFRSTVRDWAGDATVKVGERELPAYSWEAAEITLGHVVGNDATRAYRRGDALEERRGLLQDWAAYLDGTLAPELSLAA